MKLDVRANGKLQKFEKNNFVNVNVLLTSLRIQKELEKNINADILTDGLDLICEVFDNQFTRNELARSVSYMDIIPLIDDVVHEVIVNLELSKEVPAPIESSVISLEDKRRTKRN